MIANRFIHLRTETFQKAPEEYAELVNEGLYGKGLSHWLQERLTEVGYEVPFVCAEDWGWWVEIGGLDFAMGLCVYGWADEDGVIREYAIASSVDRERAWSWRHWRTVRTVEGVNRILDAVVACLRKKPDVEGVERVDEFPM